MIGAYLRDSLNEAESVNEWQPKPCYPLAVALASVGRRVTKGARRVELAVEIVQRWCADRSTDGTAFLEYTEARKKEDLEALRELGVYDSGFRSELLEGYLQNVGNGFPWDEEDRKAIARCGTRRIRRPSALELVEEGGQAKIYRFSKDGTTYAWRESELSAPREHDAFLATMEAVRKIERGELRNMDGNNYIYGLDQIGISEDGKGVEVYRWINGKSLNGSIEALSVTAAVDVGFMIAKAIWLLHDHDILHRDIAPRNVILTDAAVPVLIDFGLARSINWEMTTVKQDAPPEVRGQRPVWTKAADIYGFGLTIRALVRRGEVTEELEHLIDECLSEKPESRPKAEELLVKLEDVRTVLRVQETRNDAWNKVTEAVQLEGSAPLRPWQQNTLNRTLEKFKAQFEGIAIGIYPDMRARCAEVSAFLDQVLEGFSDEGENLTLGKAKSRGIGSAKAGQGIDFAHYLRRERSHNIRTDNQRFKKVDEQRQVNLMVEAAVQIEEGLNLAPSLTRVVRVVLSFGEVH